MDSSRGGKRPSRPHSLSTSVLPQLPQGLSDRETSLQSHEPTRRRGTVHRGYSDNPAAAETPCSALARDDPFDNSGVSGETWIDFLRRTRSESNTLAPLGSSTSGYVQHQARFPTPGESGLRTLQEARRNAMLAERKRRLTTPESPRRRVGVRPSEMSRPSASGVGSMPGFGSEGNSGSSVAHAIDLTVASPSSPRRSGSIEQSGEGDIVLPRWQPDAEVSKCPVCDTQFTFWYRKHHCRKCGRVVCASCSPHRITIPRQFIVHPPASASGESATTIIDLTRETPPEHSTSNHGRRGSYLNPALGGGEEVRVCNPCVPDPNYSPPPQQGLLPFPTLERGPLQRSSPNQAATGSPEQARNRPYTFTGVGNSQMPQAAAAGFLGRGFTNQNSSAVSAGRSALESFNNAPASTQLHQQGSHIIPPNFFRPVPAYPNGTAPFHVYHPSFQRAEHNGSAVPPISIPARQGQLDVNGPLPPAPQARPAPIPRQIAEEDECPVCGHELPPRSRRGSDSAREQHVKDCIQSHFLGSSAAPSSAPARTSAGASSTGMATGESAVGSAEPQRRRAGTGTRMLVYRATEKDCVGDDGAQAECVICFEDLEVGDEMGRLECLCKFHRACIRRWWETKGAGSCPTHQLHE